jgi:hypothetical protein
MLVRQASQKEDERALIERAAHWPKYPVLADLSADVLREISGSKGIDFATALLFNRIVRSPEHEPFIRRLESLGKATTDNIRPLNATLAVAPGAFYIEHPNTGANGHVLRQEAARWGCRTELIPCFSVGTPAENGRVICDWLAGQSDENIILASLSKGGADIKMALAEPDAPEAFRNVVAWINLGGILEGSPMVRWLFSRKLPALLYRLIFWFRGDNFQFIRDLDRSPGSPLDFELRVPEHLTMIHVVGFPLVRHISGGRARRWHRRLSSFGPNDAVTILADVCKLPGLILPVWGTDHYLHPGWDPRSLVAALLQYLGEELNLFRPPAPADMVTK